jgi:hypothetical protein
VRLCKLVAILPCFALTACATEARHTVFISGATAMPAGPGSRVSLDGLPMHTPIISRGWAFGTVIPQGWCYYITDVYYSAKLIETGGSRRSSGLVLNGLVTVYDYQSHYRPATPLIAPPGFKVTGSFTNNTAEEQNMLAIVSGYLEPVEAGMCPEPRRIRIWRGSGFDGATRSRLGWLTIAVALSSPPPRLPPTRAAGARAPSAAPAARLLGRPRPGRHRVERFGYRLSLTRVGEGEWGARFSANPMWAQKGYGVADTPWRSV